MKLRTRQRAIASCLLAGAVLLFAVARASAAEGDLDPTFNPGTGTDDFLLTTTVQPDGKIIIGGRFTTYNGTARNCIARVNADGSLDPAFNPGTGTDVPGFVFATALQPDGKIIIGGNFSGYNGTPRGGVARLNADGSLDATFNPGTGADNEVDSITLQPDGKIIIGGNFSSYNGTARNHIARINANGSLDATFAPGTGSSGEVFTTAVQPDGKILIGGFFSIYNGTTRNYLARINADGSLDTTFDPAAGPDARLSTLTLQPDGKIIIAGDFNNYTGTPRKFIARVNADGSLDPTFDPGAGPVAQVLTIAVRPDGKIIIGGVFPDYGGISRSSIARINADGSLDTTFDPGTGAVNGVQTIAVQPDGKIIIGGNFLTYNGTGRNHVARVLASAPAPPVITSPPVATGTVGLPFIYQFEASGATSLGVSNLPRDLTFNSGLRAITGVPATQGTYLVGLSATNPLGTTNATLTLTVQPAPAGPVIVSSTAVTGRAGQPFTYRVITTGGSPAGRLSTSGLPAGLSADPVTGIISGIVAVEGSSAVTLTVTDGAVTTNSVVQLAFTSDPARPVIVSPDSATLRPGQAVSYTIRAPSSAGPSDPTIFTLIGTLPQGLVFDAAAGVISGTYTGPLRSQGKSARPDAPELTGGALLGAVQFFGTNSHGSGTFQLLFLRAPSGLVNISTRMLVGTGENVLIAGFIVTGNAPKTAIVRAIGPSLAAAGISGALQDPTAELHDSAHPNIVVSDDNWKDSQEQIIRDAFLSPTDDHESAVVIGLDPGSYTTIVAGKNGTTGVAVVELYDLGTAGLDASSSAALAQISTRGTVSTGDNVMIGGFIISGVATRVIVRAIGPELNGFLSGALQDTLLELHDSSGALIASNDDWRASQEQEIIATGVPPADNRESAIVATLNPGAYTGIVRGKNNTTGVALIEAYNLP